MAGCKKSEVSSPSPHSSTCRNPLIDNKLHRSSSTDGGSGGYGRHGSVSLGTHIRCDSAAIVDNKENSHPNSKLDCKSTGKSDENRPILGFSKGKCQAKDNSLKPSSLQLRMKEQEQDSSIGLKVWDSFDTEKSHSGNIWDYSDSESAPVSSWSTFPNRSLLCRPLLVDVGRCTCIILKESSPSGFNGGTLYTLYTNEGKGRQNRKLAVAYHRRRRGRSEFTIAQNTKGIVAASDDSLIGKMSANLVGSKYYIWDQGQCGKAKLLASVKFIPTVSTWSGNYRSMRAWIPKHQSQLLKNTNQVQHINGLPVDWEENMGRVHQLFSKVPSYNKLSKQYELDFKEKGKGGPSIQSSVKNFQLTMEKNGKQTILQLGRLGKSKYLMDFRYPLTGYQAFCMCLASMDSKLCCTV